MKISKEAKVGLLVTGAIAALLWGMNYLKGVDLFTGVNTYYATYNQVDGLTPSSDVIMSGVKVGQVEKIEFLKDNSGRIRVTLQVRKKIFISKTSVARIISADLLGDRSIEIMLDPGGEAAQNGDSLQSDIQVTLSDQVMPIKDKAENLITSLDSLAIAINSVLGPDNRERLNSSFKNLDKTLVSLERASRNLDAMVQPGTGKLSNMIENIESITGNIEENNEMLANALQNISAISDSLAKSSLTSTINNANATLKETASIMEKINSGQGTVGMLINNDSLYNALEQSAVDLDKLIVDLKENPKRYVHISLFGGGKSKSKSK